MKTKTHTKLTPIALAACSFAIGSQRGPQNGAWQQILPASDFAAYDGRPYEVPGNKWKINNKSGAAIAATLNARNLQGQPLIFDYEHQTLLTRENGQKAPSSGNAQMFEWRDEVGLFAELKYTPVALKHVQDEEYLFFSPVIIYDKETGDVLDLHSVALTNDPAIKGMDRAALSFSLNDFTTPPDQEKPMNEAIALLFSLLGLAEPTETEVASLKAKLDTEEVKTAVATLKANLKKAADSEKTIAALKATIDKGADITKYVPVETYNGVLTEMATLKADHESLSVDQVIEQAEKEGKYIARAELTYLKDMGNQNLAALKATLDARPVLAALNGKQSKEAPPANVEGKTTVTVALSANQKLIATQLGISHEDYAKQLSVIRFNPRLQNI